MDNVVSDSGYVRLVVNRSVDAYGRWLIRYDSTSGHKTYFNICKRYVRVPRFLWARMNPNEKLVP